MFISRSILLKTKEIQLQKTTVWNIINVRFIQHKKMNAPVVETKLGKLKGAYRDNVDGGQYISFRGVPFAEPPTGELRFKEPQPLKSWTGIKDALKESKMSAQYDILMNIKEGGDDCLYLDIATNSLTEKKPVMVFIHGGAFKKSSNTYKKYGPDYLLKQDIVYVSINYRLGVLGFLNMEHEDCAGNQGIKDQVAALKWIKENVEVFGGDSSNITVFGQSAGSVSLHTLCLSSQAKGLFHKAILQSGVITNPWAHIKSNKEHGYALAKAFGKEISDPSEVIEFLKSIPAVDLVEKHEILNAKETLKLNLTLVPSVDSKSSDPIFLKPIEISKINDIGVPSIIGYTSHEGILRFIGGSEGVLKDLNENFERVIADCFRLSDVEKISKIAETVRNFYFGNDDITEKKIDEAVQFFGDMAFVKDIQKVADNQMKKSLPTYFYRYSYLSDFPGIKERFKVDIEGTCHGDELGCLFFSEMRREPLKKGTRDRMAMERLTRMWTNFAKYGDPTPETDDYITTKWKPLEKDHKNYLEINDNLTLGENPDHEAWQMWKSLVEYM